MANIRLTEVKINAVDVTSDLISWEIRRDYGDPIDEATLEFTQNVSDTVTLATGQTVEIKMGFVTATDDTVFSGELITFEPEAGTITVKAYNKLYATVRTQVTKVFDPSVGGDPTNPDGEISLAFHDLVTTEAGLTATHGTDIQDSGTTLVITQFVCDNTDIKERLDKLAEALGWVYYYNPSDDKVKFHPKQTTVNNAILFVGGVGLPTLGIRVSNVPKWKYDKTDLINDLRVDGAFQLDQFEETFTGTGSDATFTLTHTPIGDFALYYGDTKDYTANAPDQSELQTIEIADATADADYTIDRLQNTFTTDGINPTANNDNLLARYQIARAIPVHYRDDNSVTDFGLHARTIQLTDTVTVADVEARTTEVVEKFKIPFQSAVLEVPYSNGLSVQLGDSIRVYDEINNPTVGVTTQEFFTVYGVTLRYPDGFDEIKVGDREFDPPEYFINTSERIHRLERELLDENTILSEIRKVDFPFKFEPHSLTVTTELINDSFILGHSVNGLLHAATDALTLNDFENLAHWAEDSGSVTLTESADSTAGHFFVGTQGINYSWVATSGTGIILSTQSIGDISGATGAASGTPAQGTAGVWVYLPTGADISDITLRIGSSSSDYVQATGQTYDDKVYTASSFSITDATRTLILFDLDGGSVTGTPDWTAVDYVQIRWTVAAAGDMTFDYATVSEDNTISLNGLGDRATQHSSATTNY